MSEAIISFFIGSPLRRTCQSRRKKSSPAREVPSAESLQAEFSFLCAAVRSRRRSVLSSVPFLLFRLPHFMHARRVLPVSFVFLQSCVLSLSDPSFFISSKKFFFTCRTRHSIFIIIIISIYFTWLNDIFRNFHLAAPQPPTEAQSEAQPYKK